MVSENDKDRRARQEKEFRDSIARAICPDIREDQAANFIVEHLSTSKYKLGIDEARSTQSDHVFKDNSALWLALIGASIQANAVVKLKNFTLTEWVPRSPGTFHTYDATRARDVAWQHRLSEEEYRYGPSRFAPLSISTLFDPRRRRFPNREVSDRLSAEAPVVFSPEGKLSMIQGGIGCVRLLPIVLRGETFWLWGATSSGVAHEGVPVAIRDDEYSKFAEAVVNGGLTCNLTCRLRFIKAPEQLEFGRRIPRCYLEIENLDASTSRVQLSPKLGLGMRSKTTSCLVCAAVSFEHPVKGLLATYASFETGIKHSFDQAVEWMDKEYVNGIYKGRIVTDFDEKFSPFSNALFSLRDVMSGCLAKENVKVPISIQDNYYVERIVRAVENTRSITIEKVEAMNYKVIKIGHSSTINAPITVADSIENSFNDLQNVPDQGEIKNLLEKLLKSIAEISSEIPDDVSKRLVRDADDIVREVTSKELRKDVCRTYLDRISTTATALGPIAVPLTNCVTALLKFFT